MKRQVTTAVFILTALLAALSWARPHQFLSSGQASPAPIDKGETPAKFQTATFALG